MIDLGSSISGVHSLSAPRQGIQLYLYHTNEPDETTDVINKIICIAEENIELAIETLVAIDEQFELSLVIGEVDQNSPDPNAQHYGNSPHLNIQPDQLETTDDTIKIISIVEENTELSIEIMSAVDHQLELTILQQQKKQIESFNVIHGAAAAHQNATTNQDALAYEAKQDLNDEVFQAIKDIEKRIIEIPKQINLGISTMCAAEEQFDFRMLLALQGYKQQVSDTIQALKTNLEQLKILQKIKQNNHSTQQRHHRTASHEFSRTNQNVHLNHLLQMSQPSHRAASNQFGSTGQNLRLNYPIAMSHVDTRIEEQIDEHKNIIILAIKTLIGLDDQFVLDIDRPNI
ncbi:unnamed protein product [Adineta steineri]|uniref:Uncharacterized protein n=1 Tax=Adineta steineri TaxID=433720 RepID=A0A819E404_9BILA|nr:unnamed protein product [Adineta steineri]